MNENEIPLGYVYTRVGDRAWRAPIGDTQAMINESLRLYFEDIRQNHRRYYAEWARSVRPMRKKIWRMACVRPRAFAPRPYTLTIDTSPMEFINISNVLGGRQPEILMVD